MADEDNDDLRELKFVYEKARHHRTFHADGAWASSTPRGEIQISFFNDLHSTPQYQVHEIANSELGRELSRVLSNDVTRELNVTVVMDRETIRALMELLTSVLARIQKQVEGQDAEAHPERAS